MSRKLKRTAVCEREIVIVNYNNGKTVREIAEITNISKSTVFDIIKRYKEEGRIENKNRPPSKKKKLNTEHEKFLISEVKNDPFLSAPKLAAMLKKDKNVEVHPENVRRVLRRHNLRGRVARRKPFISKKNQKERMQFAKEYGSKDFSYWSNVLFTDESKFNMFGSDGKRCVWRKPNTELSKKNLRPTIKHGGGSVMVWGCMSASGVGNLHIIEGNMDKMMYLNILKANAKQSAEKLGIKDRFIFYQDNDPKHSAGIVKEWLLYNCPKVIKTPAQSPDLNVIEHLWQRLKMKMADRTCSNKEQLKRALQDEWNKIEPSFCRKLVQSMPQRLEAVRKQKGLPTKY